MCRERGEMRAATAEEAKRLGIPPAYTNVRVAVDPKADLVATATTGKGKTYYKYSAAFTERNARAKWARVRKLSKKADRIAERIDKDSRSGDCVAMTARLILFTGLRVGNESQGDAETFGASNLQMDHVSIDGEAVRLQFPGKHSVAQDVTVRDEVFAAYARTRVGQELLFPHNAGHVLRYMKSIGAAKAHDLRTWRANLIADAVIKQLLEIEKPESKKAVKAFKKLVSEKVAGVLGNKPSQCLKSYIDPAKWDVLGESE
jgi:DNA topoisomerase I